MPLTFDIKPILDQIKAFLLSAYTNNLPAVTDAVTGYLAATESRLKDLADGALSGELKGAEVVKSLGEEAKNLENELLSIGLIVGSDLQQLANNAIGIFTGSLMDALYSFNPNKKNL